MNTRPHQAALDYLYSFVDFSLQRADPNMLTHFDLARMRAFAASLGDPQTRYPVIHVAGTKGKGSVAAMCASAFQAAGLRVGFYTSPHLQDFTERIQVDGSPVPWEDLVELVEAIKPYVAAIPRLTTFEITTALAFWYFARRQVDVAVVEVGLGGRLDATNIVTPQVSVITSISYDHTALLGDTLAQIAGEKCGIIKPGVPVVSAPQKDEALRVITQIAQERQCPLVEVGNHLRYAPRQRSLDGQTFLVWEAAEQPKMDVFLDGAGQTGWQPIHLTVPLLGIHQVENAATAYAALNIWQEKVGPLPEDAIRRGFGQVRWPGRFEILRREPPVVVDSAHNRDSALKLRLALADYFSNWPVLMLFGASEDKDVAGMFAELLPCVEQVIATQSFHPRATPAEKLAELAHRFGRPAQAISSVEDALAEALRLAGRDKLILAAGSLFIAAAVRDTWGRISK